VNLLPELESARVWLAHALWEQGKGDAARQECSRLLTQNPDSLDAMRLLASIEAGCGHLRQARQLLQTIVQKVPGSSRALNDLATFHAGQHAYAEAIDLLRRAIELAPGDARLRFTLAGHLLTTGFPDKALSEFDAGLSLDPDSSRGKMGRLYALRGLGRTQEVIEGSRELIEKDIYPSEVWWSLSSLRTYDFRDNDVERMQALRKSAALSGTDATYLDFALGKAMDDRGRYDDAWRYYISGNAGRRKVMQWDRDEHEHAISTIIDCFDAETLARSVTKHSGGDLPIFIVGVPRSGSTLVEQILASHTAVEATTELPYFAGLGEGQVFASSGDAPPIRDADAEQLARISDRYLRATEIHRREGVTYFVDKELDNFLYSGLIAMALPQARIIDVRRHPLDACVGNFRQWFGHGKAFSYDLDDLAHYYLQYRRIMRHWSEVMPGRVLEVCYEDLVDDTESQVRRMLEYCDLPWEPACLDFHRRGRAVTTASSEQVRQPIYRTAIGFWKNYEKHLADLRQSLAAVLVQ
jgi:tetratricopeptide (TPR) repeat protein